MATKFGRQPFLDVLIERNISQRQAAAATKIPRLHLRHSGYGYVTPKTELRRALSEYLGLPVEKLFTAESLSATPHYGHQARRQMIEARDGGPYQLAETDADSLPRVVDTLADALRVSKDRGDATFRLRSTEGLDLAVIRGGQIKDISLAAA